MHIEEILHKENESGIYFVVTQVANIKDIFTERESALMRQSKLDNMTSPIYWEIVE